MRAFFACLTKFDKFEKVVFVIVDADFRLWDFFGKRSIEKHTVFIRSTAEVSPCAPHARLRTALTSSGAATLARARHPQHRLVRSALRWPPIA